MRTMDAMYLEDPTRGSRRYAADLALAGIEIGRAKVRSLMRTMGIEAIYRQPATTIADGSRYKYPYLLRGLSISRTHEVWQTDISYIPMEKGFMYLCAIIDVYSRAIVGWSISNAMDAAWVVSVVKEAVAGYGKPGIINSDQGSQFTSDEYTGYVGSLETVKISMNGKGRATDNAYIERFFRTIKYEKLYLSPASDGLQLYGQCNDYIAYYNEKRSHSQIGKRPPAERLRQAA